MNYRQLSVKEVWAFSPSATLRANGERLASSEVEMSRTVSILVLRIAVRAIARTNGYRVLRMPTAIRS
ncbi:hypothetical protein [Brasilonema octagenarum]|uniref:hypothetical protein n=1 Tax=Brasilonema octagenarum TaxID=417105 RepID=UPI00145E6130|nr:hypothetical protein [Brasilonema octagenarum]